MTFITMIEVKTAELIGPALRHAVATALGYTKGEGQWCEPAWFDNHGRLVAQFNLWMPDFDWSQGGPLIEQYQIWLTGPFRRRKSWKASSGRASDCVFAKSEREGLSPLVAAMRCLVAGRYGDTVQVPEELLP